MKNAREFFLPGIVLQQSENFIYTKRSRKLELI
jgi:hypothetical protein